MKIQQPIMLQAEVQTPVFIGDGDTVSPLSYLVEGHDVFVVDGARFLRALAPEVQTAYMAWIDPYLARIADFDVQAERAWQQHNRDLQRQLRRKKRAVEGKLALFEFFQQLKVKKPAALLRSIGSVLYKVRWTVNPRNDGFRSFIKSAHRPYVPGTELKGAWRTALLYVLAGQAPTEAVFQQQLEALCDASKYHRVRSLEQIAGTIEKTALRGKKDDAQYDILRFMQVSDSDMLSAETLRVQALESEGTHRNTRTLAEALEPGTMFNFRLTLADAEDDKMQETFDKLGLQTAATAVLSREKLLDATYQRSQAILAADAEYFRRDAPMMREIAHLQAANTSESPLLRLGMGQGFLSTTVDLRVKENDADLYDKAIRESVDLKNRNWHTYRNNFPKTRRTVRDGDGNLLTVPGWVKLRVIET